MYRDDEGVMKRLTKAAMEVTGVESARASLGKCVTILPAPSDGETRRTQGWDVPRPSQILISSTPSSPAHRTALDTLSTSARLASNACVKLFGEDG